MAEDLVFNQLYAQNPSITITVLTIIDRDWQDMTGDDWLNSSKSHTSFLDHVEQQMRDENEIDWQRIKSTYANAESAGFKMIVGNIEETIAEQAKELNCDLIVIGPWRKNRRLFNFKLEKGLKARIKPEILHPLIHCPVLIAPYR